MKQERRYAPSTEKVVPDEADDPRKRGCANLFVDRLIRSMDESEHGPNAMTPSVDVVLKAYRQTKESFQYDPAGLFSIREAYGAAVRRYLFQQELADETLKRFGKLPEIDGINLKKLQQLAEVIDHCANT